MSKMYDNGTMRDATTEEATEINTNLGGGISQEYELIGEATITESDEPQKYVITYENTNIAGYDDLILDAKNVLADTNNSSLTVAVRTNANLTSTNYLNINNVSLSDTTPHRYYWMIERMTETYVRQIMSGTTKDYNVAELNNNPKYSDKMWRIVVYTNNKIKQGDFKLYGRRRI